MNTLYAVHWTEYERGWGSRPDGIQFFDSEDRAKNHIAKVMAERDARSVPDEYSSPGDIMIMQVSKDLYDLVMKRTMYWSSFNTSHSALNYVYDPRHDPAPKPTRAELDQGLADIFDSMTPDEAKLAVGHIHANRERVADYLTAVAALDE
jgi:hypothetical protein